MNINKTKLIIFNKASQVLKDQNFCYGNILLEHVNEYKLLGIYLRLSGFFTQVSSTFVITHLKPSSVLRKLLIQTV